jgi:glycosyltransferase involved in cell wall biosynthesis
VARRLGLFSRGQRAIALPPGIDPEQYHPRGGDELRRELGADSATPIAGMIACLKPQKAPLTFVRAAALLAARLPQMHFFIAGDGELRGAVQDAIVEHGMQGRFHLLGWRRDVPRLLDAADALVLTSLWEGLPRVALQAMAAAKPLVAAAVDGIPEAVVDGFTGYLLSPDDISGFADRLEKLMCRPDLRRSMGAAAHARLADFGLDVTMQKLEAFYEEMLGWH